MKTLIIQPFAQILILAALLIAPFAITPAVSAHHCLGHEGEGPGNFVECLDAGACVSTTGENCPAQATAETKVNDIITLVVNLLSFIVGIVAVIMIIIGGLKYITSGGDANNVSSAKNTILYAVIGLVVVALAQVIVRFVLQKSTQTPSATPAGIIRLA